MTEDNNPASGFVSPFTVKEGMRVLPAYGNSTAGARQVYRLYERGELWPVGIALMNFLLEFRLLSSELIDRSFMSLRPEDPGYAGLPRLSSGRRKGPYRGVTEKLFTYGVLNRYVVLSEKERWYVYALSSGAREWLLTMGKTGGVVRHPLYRNGLATELKIREDGSLDPREVMRCLSIAQAAVSIRAAYKDFDVSLSVLGGCDTLLVKSNSQDVCRSILIHPVFSDSRGVKEAAAFISAIGEETDRGTWDGPESFSVAFLTDGEAAAAGVLHPGMLKEAPNAYAALHVMYLFDFVTFYFDRPLDSLHYYPEENTKMFEIRSWPG